MGGGGGQKALNAAMAKENAKRQVEYDRIRIENERKAKQMEYTNKRTKALNKSKYEAMDAVTKERSTLLTEGAKRISDYEAQERRRFMTARQGRGQVDESDFAISTADYESTKEMMAKGADYWDAKREAAGNTAFTQAEKDFEEEFGTEDKYLQGLEEEKDKPEKPKKPEKPWSPFDMSSEDKKPWSPLDMSGEGKEW